MFGRRALTPLEERLGYRFAQPELLDLAVTHRSRANEQGIPDTITAGVPGRRRPRPATAEWLYTAHPHLPEGELSKLKARW
jgi:ribonuclease-3